MQWSCHGFLHIATACDLTVPCQSFHTWLVWWFQWLSVTLIGLKCWLKECCSVLATLAPRSWCQKVNRPRPCAWCRHRKLWDALRSVGGSVVSVNCTKSLEFSPCLFCYAVGCIMVSVVECCAGHPMPKAPAVASIPIPVWSEVGVAEVNGMTHISIFSEYVTEFQCKCTLL